MCQAVCLFRTPTSLAFGTVSEDVSGQALVWALPKGGRQGVFVGMSRAVCLFACSTSFAFGGNFEDVSGGALVLALPGGTPGCNHGPVRAQIVGMSQAVCLFRTSTSLAFGADFEDVSGGALVSALPRGGARGYCTGPFAPRLWGCLRRFTCFGPQHLLLSEQFLRMSQARRWFWYSQGGAPGGRR